MANELRDKLAKMMATKIYSGTTYADSPSPRETMCAEAIEPLVSEMRELIDDLWTYLICSDDQSPHVTELAIRARAMLDKLK